MKETLRMVAAGATGAIMAAAVLAGPPALAGATAAKNSVTSKSIKNGQVKEKDLNASVNASLDKADTALQSVPDGSVSNSKLADNAVTNAKMADNAVGSAEVAANSLAAADLAADSVGASEVNDGSLDSDDVTGAHGTVDHDFPNIANGACDSFTQAAGGVVAGDLILVNADLSLQDGLVVLGRGGPGAGNASNIQISVCNFSGALINPNDTTFAWGVIEN
jgi:hypothetical protein